MRYNDAMDLTNIDDVKAAMRLAGLRASKSLGQHFLVDRESLLAVIRGGNLMPDDVVLEIGPGLGVMTGPLTGAVKNVIAVEADPALAALLDRDKPENLEVWQEDIMEIDTSRLPAEYKIVANIPYYLTSAIIRLFLENDHPPKLMSILIQLEVAKRITAHPGQMSVLAFSVQYYGKPVLTTVVPRDKFWPVPNVDSAVLAIERYDAPMFDADTAKLFRLVKAGFGEKRKMLKNSLAGGLNIAMEISISTIAQAEINPMARAQELSMEEWRRLYSAADLNGLL